MAKTSKKTLQVIAEITKIETMQKGLKLTVLTNEVGPEDAAVLMAYRDEQGWLLFKPSDKAFSAEDIANLPEVKYEKDEKTPSQRLRSVLYVFWEQTGGIKRADKKSFIQFYNEAIEKYIVSIKERLEQ